MLLNALVVISGLLLSVAGIAQSQKIPSPREVVSPSVYVSADPAARGVPFQLAVVFKIRPGFHVWFIRKASFTSSLFRRLR
jgi:hypothetical protein